MATVLGVEFAKALLARACEALKDPALPGHMERHWKREKNKALAVLAEHRASEEASATVTVHRIRL